MNSTSVNERFVISSVPRRDWASHFSPSRSLPEILFLSSAAKQSLPENEIASSPAAPRNDRRVRFADTLLARHPIDPRIFIEVVIKGKSLGNTQPFHDYEARTINKAE